MEELSQVDPQMGSCIVFIPQSSPMKGAGKNGEDIGANILKRYEDGVLTDQTLWDADTGAFPCGAIVSGLNDVSSSSCFDVHERLNVNANGCALEMAQEAGTATADSAVSCFVNTLNQSIPKQWIWLLVLLTLAVGITFGAGLKAHSARRLASGLRTRLRHDKSVTTPGKLRARLRHAKSVTTPR